MKKLLWKCPVCGDELRVTGLECGNCGTEIRGHFELGRLGRLDGDDLNFVEIFVKNRGNAYRVGEELEIPYSAVRARLTQIIDAMGYEAEPEPREEAGIPSERRKAILEELAHGKISSDDAVRKLQSENS